MKTVKVNTRQKYEVIIDGGLIGDAGALIYRHLYKNKDITKIKALVVYNEDLKKYVGGLLESLTTAGFAVQSMEVPIGEKSKDYHTLGDILNKLTEIDFSREDVIISFGGGSVGDVTGFASSVYKRGTRLVHIPTTLLAMVDSSVGGKTALNYKNYKNLIGSFYQPDLVIDDTKVLATIEGKNLRSGVGELIKYGVIDKSIFYKLFSEVHVDNVEDLIFDCINVKAKLVAKDEYDEGARRFLNLGHTVGHAIETLSDFRTPHGIAVACGILAIAHCQDAAYCTHTAEKIKRILDIQGILTEIPYSADDILRVINKDKKWAYGKLTVVLFDDIGECRIRDFTPEELEVFIKGGLYAC